jgi:hypothetical protein
MSAPADGPRAAGPGDLAKLQDNDLQSLFAAIIREYAARAETRDEPLPALPPDSGVTATEAMLAVSAILRAVNIQVFELGMWQSWSGR